MPDHFHGIVSLVGATQCGRPSHSTQCGTYGRPHMDARGHASTRDGHVGPSLQGIIGWFKTMTTNEYIRNVKTNNWPYFDGKLWQRSYYETIIRNNDHLKRITEYIQNNPMHHK
ncbi:MAG: transposase [Patescibacteria group bacterium]